jgi:hypothetical protein
MNNFSNRELSQAKVTINKMNAPYTVKQLLLDLVNKQQTKRKNELMRTHNHAMSLLRPRPGVSKRQKKKFTLR